MFSCNTRRSVRLENKFLDSTCLFWFYQFLLFLVKQFFVCIDLKSALRNGSISLFFDLAECGELGQMPVDVTDRS